MSPGNALSASVAAARRLASELVVVSAWSRRKSASFSNVSIVPWVLRGVYVPDVITILASIYFILGDIDR